MDQIYYKIKFIYYCKSNNINNKIYIYSNKLVNKYYDDIKFNAFVNSYISEKKINVCIHLDFGKMKNYNIQYNLLQLRLQFCNDMINFNLLGSINRLAIINCKNVKNIILTGKIFTLVIYGKHNLTCIINLHTLNNVELTKYIYGLHTCKNLNNILYETLHNRKEIINQINKLKKIYQ